MLVSKSFINICLLPDSPPLLPEKKMVMNDHQRLRPGTMTTHSSRIGSTDNSVSSREPSSASNTQLGDDIESGSFHDATPADALHISPNNEESIHVHNERPNSLSQVSRLSCDGTSGVTGVVSGAGIIQHSDTSDDLGTAQSSSVDLSQDLGNGSDREENYTISPNHSIRTPLSDTDGIYQDVSSTSVGSRRRWTPFFLQRATTLYFVIAYALLLLALIVLAVLDNRNKGLATVDSNFRYVWAYGPTAGTTFL